MKFRDLLSNVLLRKLAALGAYAAGLGLMALTLGLIWYGHPYAIPHVVYVEQPVPHLLGGIAGLLIGRWLHRGFPTTPRAWAAVFGKCLLLSISLGLSFLVGEIGYRAMLARAQQENSLSKLKTARAGAPLKIHSSHPLALIVQVSDDSKLMYELQPGLDMEFGHKSLKTNRDGQRETRDYPVERTPHSVRIVGLGDSGMFGWNCDQDQAYMDVLEHRLQGRGDGVTYEVLNLGVPGYNTRLEAEMLRVKGLKYKPDIVIVGWCSNDYEKPFFLMDRENLQRTDMSYLYTWMFARTNLAHLVGGFRMTDRRDFLSSQGTNAVSFVAEQEVELAARDLKAMSDAQGFKLLFFGPMDEHIKKVCRDLHIAFYNTLEHIDPSKYPADWAVLFMHPRPQGHAVLAECLEKELDRLNWLKPRP